VATLYRINIIILHYSVGASLNESDIIVRAGELPCQLQQRQSYEGILPRRLRSRQLYRFDQRRITIAP